jgi:hypothetical protein
MNTAPATRVTKRIIVAHTIRRPLASREHLFELSEYFPVLPRKACLFINTLRSPDPTARFWRRRRKPMSHWLPTPDNLLLHMQQKVAEAKNALEISELFGRGFAAQLRTKAKARRALLSRRA